MCFSGGRKRPGVRVQKYLDEAGPSSPSEDGFRHPSALRMEDIQGKVSSLMSPAASLAQRVAKDICLPRLVVAFRRLLAGFCMSQARSRRRTVAYARGEQKGRALGPSTRRAEDIRRHIPALGGGKDWEMGGARMSPSLQIAPVKSPRIRQSHPESFAATIRDTPSRPGYKVVDTGPPPWVDKNPHRRCYTRWERRNVQVVVSKKKLESIRLVRPIVVG